MSLVNRVLRYRVACELL